jgi:hypothetical protein
MTHAARVRRNEARALSDSMVRAKNYDFLDDITSGSESEVS